MLRWTAKVRSLGITALVVAVGLVLAGLAGCGSQPSAGPQRSPEVVASETPSSPSPMSSPSEITTSPAPSDSISPAVTSTEEPSEGDEPGEDESERPPVLDQQATGRDLTMSDFFSAPSEWHDGRFEVAGRRNLPGIGGPLGYCQHDQADHDTLELRLANRFKKVSAKIGQSDDSEQSDAVLNVRLLGNGKYIDSVKVPFNKIDDFSASVSDVNALKVEVWIGGDKCDDGAVGAVLSGLRLE